MRQILFLILAITMLASCSSTPPSDLAKLARAVEDKDVVTFRQYVDLERIIQASLRAQFPDQETAKAVYEKQGLVLLQMLEKQIGDGSIANGGIWTPDKLRTAKIVPSADGTTATATVEVDQKQITLAMARESKWEHFVVVDVQIDQAQEKP